MVSPDVKELVHPSPLGGASPPSSPPQLHCPASTGDRRGCREDFRPCFAFCKQLAAPGQGALAACSPALPQ